jgi:hypothetical protein
MCCVAIMQLFNITGAGKKLSKFTTYWRRGKNIFVSLQHGKIPYYFLVYNTL